jgi:hypothetical protein
MVTVYAECLRNAPGATVEQTATNTIGVPAHSNASGLASCNPGEVVVGGGFIGPSALMDTPAGVEVYNFTASGSSQWGGYAQNYNALPQPITFYAECLKYAGAHSSFTLPPNQYAIGSGAVGGGNSPACPGNMYVSGGGFADRAFALPTLMTANGKVWQVQIQSSAGHTNQLNAYAMCLGF